MLQASDEFEVGELGEKFAVCGIEGQLKMLRQLDVEGVVEGPEAGVYYRGESILQEGTARIQLPDYFEALTRKEDRTILLTNIDGPDVLFVKTQGGEIIKNGMFIIASQNLQSRQKFFWEVKAIRVDVPPLQVVR